MKIKRIIYCILGFLFLCLGCIGIVLPILPTVPFLLLASFFISRGSRRFDEWFQRSTIYKKYLENFVRNKTMTLKGELILLSCVSMMLFFSMWYVNKLYVSIMITALIIIMFLYFLFCIDVVSKKEYIRRREQLKDEMKPFYQVSSK